MPLGKKRQKNFFFNIMKKTIHIFIYYKLFCLCIIINYIFNNQEIDKIIINIKSFLLIYKISIIF